MVLFFAFVITLVSWLGLASVGHDFWLHRKYIEKLMQLFEYGRKRVEKVQTKVRDRQRKLSRINEDKFREESDGEESDIFDEKAGN